jgi:hypothetical protein
MDITITDESSMREDIKELFQALYILNYGLHPRTGSSSLYDDDKDRFSFQAITVHNLSPLSNHVPRYPDEAAAIIFVQKTVLKFTEKYPEFLPDMGFMTNFAGHKDIVVDGDLQRDATWKVKTLEDVIQKSVNSSTSG